MRLSIDFDVLIDILFWKKKKKMDESRASLLLLGFSRFWIARLKWSRDDRLVQ